MCIASGLGSDWDLHMKQYGRRSLGKFSELHMEKTKAGRKTVESEEMGQRQKWTRNCLYQEVAAETQQEGLELRGMPGSWCVVGAQHKCTGIVQPPAGLGV